VEYFDDEINSLLVTPKEVELLDGVEDFLNVLLVGARRQW
jgi:hypothetical protein